MTRKTTYADTFNLLHRVLITTDNAETLYMYLQSVQLLQSCKHAFVDGDQLVIGQIPETEQNPQIIPRRV